MAKVVTLEGMVRIAKVDVIVAHFLVDYIYYNVYNQRIVWTRDNNIVPGNNQCRHDRTLPRS